MTCVSIENHQKTNVDVWHELIIEARTDISIEPSLSLFVGRTILDSGSFEEALSKTICAKLGGEILAEDLLRNIFSEFWKDNENNPSAPARLDLMAIRNRDPACCSYLMAFLYMKGYQAVQAQRLSHWLWKQNRHHLAIMLQNRVSERLGVDIHPAVKIGSGIVVDHATNVVIGETAVLGNNVTLLQGVTLGGTGKGRGDRHPKIGDGVQIWAGAKVLGNVIVGRYSQIGACSVVLHDVPECSTVVGVPAKVVRSRHHSS